jgi:formylglycine-generating enzyme required for sulfatase activity
MHPALTVLSLAGVLVPIGSYGACLCLAIAVASALSLRAARRAGFDLGACIAALAFVTGGAFAGAVLLHATAQLARTGSFDHALSHAGIAYFGAVLGGGVALALCARPLRLDAVRLLDLSVPALACAHAIGRLGCFLGGCCHGVEWHGPWAVTHALAFAGVSGAVPRHPVAMYEATFLILLAVAFARRGDRGAGTGKPTTAYFALYAAFRVAIETLRGDVERGVFLGGSVSTSQVVGVLLLAGCLVRLVLGTRRSVRSFRMVARVVAALAPLAASVALARAALADATGASGALGVAMPSVLRIEAGAFWMGSDEDDVKFAAATCLRSGEQSGRCDATAFANEQPAHRVMLSAYRIDRTEVSQADWRRCVRAGECYPARVSEADARLGRPEHPVAGVTWDEAARYCAWVGGRLPTESEWERAARGGSGRRFPWGDAFDERLANHGRPTGDPNDADGHAYAAPVDAYRDGKSAHGLLNMAGNVWEWTADRYGADYYAKSEGTDPRGPSEGEERVIRGGSWRSAAYTLRVAQRAGLKESDSRPDVGFRCAYDAK